MRQTTEKLLDRLRAAHGGPYRVDVAKCPGDSEVIVLDEMRPDYVLAVDEDASLRTVLLDERMEVGGDVNIASWVIDGDAVLDEVAATALKAAVYGHACDPAGSSDGRDGHGDWP